MWKGEVASRLRMCHGNLLAAYKKAGINITQHTASLTLTSCKLQAGVHADRHIPTHLTPSSMIFMIAIFINRTASQGRTPHSDSHTEVN